MNDLFSTSSLESKPGFRSLLDGPRVLSVSMHLTMIVLALIPWASSQTPMLKPLIDVALHAPPHLTLPPDDKLSGGGGGGGKHLPTPASLGKLPRAADRQFVPPDPEPPKNPDPTLIVEATVVAPQLASLPQLNLISIGDPNGVPGPPAAGPGGGLGIGDGDGHGIGEGKGPGVGPGENGGFGGQAFVIGGGVTAPTLVAEVLPEYSEEARKALIQGTVVLDTVVRQDGSVEVIRVARGIGFGLDQKVIAAVLQWKFKPARMNGKPVPSYLNVEVNFTLR